jgi:hypothetical protein
MIFCVKNLWVRKIKNFDLTTISYYRMYQKTGIWAIFFMFFRPENFSNSLKLKLILGLCLGLSLGLCLGLGLGLDFDRKFFSKMTLLGLILCGESIARIPKA